MRVNDISIHALHEESDDLRVRIICRNRLISIHALHEESDKSGHGLTFYGDVFQSTLSMRRATTQRHAQLSKNANFNPRSP